MPDLWRLRWSISRRDSWRRDLLARLEQLAGRDPPRDARGRARSGASASWRCAPRELCFDILVDRAFDIGRCDWRGIPVAWGRPRARSGPWLAEQTALGWLRSFGGGLVATCGLDHTQGPGTDSLPHAYAVELDTEAYTQHGRVGTQPARLAGYGSAWEGDHCTFWAEGEVEQVSLFGERLVLRRRIEADLGGRTHPHPGRRRERRPRHLDADAALPLQRGLAHRRRWQRDPRAGHRCARDPRRPAGRLPAPRAAGAARRRARLRAGGGRRCGRPGDGGPRQPAARARARAALPARAAAHPQRLAHARRGLLLRGPGARHEPRFGSLGGARPRRAAHDRAGRGAALRPGARGAHERGGDRRGRAEVAAIRRRGAAS